MSLAPPVQFDDDGRMAEFVRWLTQSIMPLMRRGVGIPAVQKLDPDGLTLNEVRIGDATELRLYVRHNGKARYFRAEDV